eukprot:scaffold2907_cov124-Skeletonema_dohrnii-CCMP3373.AAC.3
MAREDGDGGGRAHQGCLDCPNRNRECPEMLLLALIGCREGVKARCVQQRLFLVMWTPLAMISADHKTIAFCHSEVVELYHPGDKNFRLG